MNSKTLNYAKLSLDTIAEENDIRVFIDSGNLYIELRSGNLLRISDEEVLHQATKYLQNEIESLMFL
jgi:hypothetical protein